MTTRHLPHLVLILCLCPLTFAQTRGGGGGGGGSRTGSYVQPGSDARNSAVLGTGNNINPTIVHPTSVDSEPKVEFRSQTVLIQVPVVVTDKSGNHLHGLNKEDFSLLENGKPVSVAHFEELTASTTPLAAAPAPAGQYRNLTIDGPQPRNVVVIALDTVNTPFLDQAYGRKELIKFLSKNLSSGQVSALMLITSHGLRVVQGLTGDPAHLAQVLNKVSLEVTPLETMSGDAQESLVGGTASGFAGSGDTGGDPVLSGLDHFVRYGDSVEAQFVQSNAIETTMNGFLGIAWSLSGVPGRKSVIWATAGFPFAMDSPSTVPGGYMSFLYERTMLALNDAQVSVYPVDIRGLANAPGFQNGNTSGVMSGLNASRQITNRAWLQQSKFDTLNDFADMTGGKAFYNTNDLAGSFKRASDDGSSYYMLSYYLDTANTKAGWRKLQVKVAKKDIEVRARTGFFVTNATMNPLLSRDQDIVNALRSPIEGTGVAMTVEWLTVASDGDKKKAIFAAHMPGGSLSFDAGRNAGQLNFDFAAVAYDKDGKTAGETSRNFMPVVPETQIASVREKGMDFRNAIELSPGKYTVKFVVRDNVTGRVGSVTAPLTVD